MMCNSSTFSKAGVNEIAVTQLGPILYDGSPPGVSFASRSFIPLQCVHVCVHELISYPDPLPVAILLRAGKVGLVPM